MNATRLLPLLAGAGAVAICVVYLLIMKQQADHSPSVASVLLVAVTDHPAHLGSTVALFWTLLLNTLTPLWLPVAVLVWFATVQATRRFGREDGDSAWPLVGRTWAIAVVVLGLAVFGSVMVDRSPSSGTGQGSAQPR